MDSKPGEVVPVEMAIRGRGKRGPCKRKVPRGPMPTMLETLPRPSEVTQLPAWAAKVRRRLKVLEAQLRRLGSEKQSLLGQLHLATAEVIDEVLAPTNSMDLATLS